MLLLLLLLLLDLQCRLCTQMKMVPGMATMGMTALAVVQAVTVVVEPGM